MRPLEILLILTILPPILMAFLPMRPPKWITALPLGGILVIILHLIFEDGRWQMVPAYILTAVLAILAIRTLFFSTEPSKKRWAIAIPLGIVGLLLWVVSVALPVALPVPQLTPITGTFEVGTTILHLVDESREEIYTPDPNDTRELVAQVWYPTTDTTNVDRALYLPFLDIIGPVVAERFGLPAFLLNHINITNLDIYDEPSVYQEDGQLPVIIFSHGLGGLRTQNTAMFQELASYGFVVGAVDHVYANAITVYPDGRVVLYDESIIFPTDEPRYVQANELINVWAADIAFLLDEMAVLNEEDGLFNGRLDTNNVGIFGHSTGGGTTVEFCLIDNRCAAGIGLDSWVLPVTESLLTDGPSQPFMFISTPIWLGEENQERGLNIYNSLDNDGYNLAISDTGHYDFTDLVMLSPLTPQLGLSGTIDSHYSIGIQNEYIVAFFNQYLKGIDSSEILKRPSPYPELTFESR